MLRAAGRTFDGTAPPPAQYVFGYGSLVSPPGATPGRRWSERGVVADLPGFRRSWGVAMDNRRDLPGYKYYTDPQGRRPDVLVAFLDVCPAPDADATVNGLCLPVDDAELAVLDRRERNYERIDVSDRLGGGRARVWTYAGSAAGRGRFARGRATGSAVIEAGYLRAVQAGFARLGEEECRACLESLEPDGLPVVELVRHGL